MSYQKAVKDAADALVRGEDANWELARLTYENTNRRGERHKATHEQWSADVREESHRRFSETTSQKFAMMWDRFGSDSTIVQSWTEAWYELTPRDAAEPMRARAARTHVGEGEAAQVAETVREALRRPEVARQVVSDRETNSRLARARQDYDEEVEAVAATDDSALRRGRNLDKNQAVISRLNTAAGFIDQATDMADQLDSVSAETREAAQTVLAKARHLDDKLSGAFDDAAEALLRGE